MSFLPCVFVHQLLGYLCLKLLYNIYYYSICFIVSFPFLLAISFIVYVDRRLVRYLVAANLCSRGVARVIRNYDVGCGRFPLYAKYNLIIFGNRNI